MIYPVVLILSVKLLTRIRQIHHAEVWIWARAAFFCLVNNKKHYESSESVKKSLQILKIKGQRVQDILLTPQKAAVIHAASSAKILWVLFRKWGLLAAEKGIKNFFFYQ